MPEINDKASKRLLGLKLDGGWEVVEQIERTAAQTGGFFSQGYIARSATGQEAFLKAMDFSHAAEQADFARAIEALARQFNFERDLLAFCANRRMRNVVRSIGEGVVDVVGDGNWLNKVQYLLFEPAEGDLRKIVAAYDELTVAWCLRVLHETAVGLQQLHGAMVAHQDLKPSNILSFANENKVKLGDLGCASMRGHGCPRDALHIPGQKSYAPPEQLYGYTHPDWAIRRIGSDMYQLGSICCFLIAGPSLNSMLVQHLDPEFLWTNWQGTYEEVLPHIKFAYAKVVDQLAGQLTSPLERQVLQIVRELCEPDLKARGDPFRIRRKQFQYTVEPYVSRLGNLRKQAEYSSKMVASR